jgi:serine/threonine protein kinase
MADNRPRNGPFTSHNPVSGPYLLPSALATLEVDPEQLTSSGAMLGTVASISPEQMKAKELDVRTDLFSFGSVLYEMGTREMPSDGSSAGDICGLIVHQDPVPLSRV